MSISRTRLTGTAIVAAGTLILAGAVPAVSQQTGSSPAGQSGQSSSTGASPSTGGAGSSSMTPGSSQTQGGATSATSQTTGTQDQSAASQGGAQTTTGSQAGQMGKPSQGAKSTLSGQQLRKHARAHVMIEQKAPELHAKLAQVKDVMKELSPEERQQLAQAIRPAGYTLAQYAREHRAISANPRLVTRLTQMEQQVKTRQAGGAATSSSPAGTTSGAGASSSPGGTTSGAGATSSPAAGGAQSSGAQPSSSPQ